MLLKLSLKHIYQNSEVSSSQVTAEILGEVPVEDRFAYPNCAV
jgi:hypothetical protein